MINNSVVHFEVHVSDPERASLFYSTVFGWDIKRWENNEYWMVMTKPDDTGPGINGGMVLRKGDMPTEGSPVTGYVCSLQVEDIYEALAKVCDNGGQKVVDVQTMESVGLLAYCKDTEGNIFGLWQPLPKKES